MVKFPHLRVPHATSTRQGGFSEGPYASLNLGRMSGDDLEVVERNRLQFARSIGFPIRQNLQMNHGIEVAHLQNPEDWGKSWQADACITAHPEVSLSLTTADCVPIFFHDPVKPAVGVAHAGWRGTVAGIAAQTVEAMIRSFSSQPGDLLVGLGPSISQCCFEVSREVFDEFEREFHQEPQFSERVQARPEKEKWHIDLHWANRIWLQRAGVDPSKILTCDLCTSCTQEMFYSYRRDQGRTGRLLSAIALREFSLG